LGDWYGNWIILHRRPLLLLVASRSLLAILEPARNVRDLPMRLADLVAQRLSRLGVPRRISDPEIAAMNPVHIDRTADRSVLGIMVDYAKMLSYDLEPGFSEVAEVADLRAAEEFLWDNPCHAGRPGDGSIWPREVTPELLEGRWAAS
jgi:hypothetical protein